MVYAGASQLIAVRLLAASVTIPEVILTTFIINFRHFIMSASLSQKIASDQPDVITPIIGFGITDESFALLSLEPGCNLAPWYMIGVSFTGYAGWVGGTFLGSILGTNLPYIIQDSMGIALYAMFIGLLVPGLKKSHKFLSVSLLAMFFSSIFFWGPAFLSQISEGWQIVLITVITSLIGAAIFTDEVAIDE